MITALITGASSGIGAIYARRLAARGYNLVLAARDTDRLNALATDLRTTGIDVDVLTADLTKDADVAAVATRLRSDPPIDLLVNNAGAAILGGFASTDASALDMLLRLNVRAPTLLIQAAIPGMLERGKGAVINIGSVLGLLPEYSPGIYSATKAYIQTMSQSLAAEVADKGIQVQAVLPAATRTELYDRAGGDIANVPNVMEAEALVDAALVGFDRNELITIPPVPDVAAWEALEEARMALATGFSNTVPGARYRS